MSIVGGCPICGAATALFSVLIPGTHHTRYICEDCENDINRDHLAAKTCLGCGEMPDECSWPQVFEEKAGAA